MKLFNAIATAALLGSSFVATSPAKAFWGGKAAEQKDAIIGRWQCNVSRDAKESTKKMVVSFFRDGSFRWKNKDEASSGDIKIIFESIVSGGWEINKSDMLQIEMTYLSNKNLSTALGLYGQDLQQFRDRINTDMGQEDMEQSGSSGPLNYYSIDKLSSTRFIFDQEGGGQMFVCRK
jgi:hypothetical protein